MANDGDYPLLVYVGNRFKTDVKLCVTFYHWPLGEKPTDGNGMNTNSYDIMPGDCLVFPLFWADESLTIQIPKNARTPYYIFLGPKAKCTSDDLIDNGNTMMFIPSGTAKYIAEMHKKKYSTGNYNSKSGIWKINGTISNLSIKIEKYGFDPETTNVSVGEDLP